jgi:2-oxoglutarate/2-oxoacid ferredoxin oxidoreductase subunit alpha
MDEVCAAIDKQFAGKAKAAELNKDAARIAYDWAKENLQKQTRFALRPSDRAKGKIIIEGNDAAAIGMLFGGVTVVAWYPITPSSSLAEYLGDYLDRYRRDPDTGKATYAVLQAEDELASIAMVVGAGWAGARAMTATAGPGISLMSEIAGLSYFAEIPAVIVDVQRVGPAPASRPAPARAISPRPTCSPTATANTSCSSPAASPNAMNSPWNPSTWPRNSRRSFSS